MEHASQHPKIVPSAYEQTYNCISRIPPVDTEKIFVRSGLASAIERQLGPEESILRIFVSEQSVTNFNSNGILCITNEKLIFYPLVVKNASFASFFKKDTRKEEKPQISFENKLIGSVLFGRDSVTINHKSDKRLKIELNDLPISVIEQLRDTIARIRAD